MFIQKLNFVKKNLFQKEIQVSNYYLNINKKNLNFIYMRENV